MELDWVEEKYSDTFSYRSKYDVWDTPFGPAYVEVEIIPYRGIHEWAEYGSGLYDPFLQALDGTYYEKFAYGSQRCDSYETSVRAAMDTCEGFGVKEAMKGPFGRRTSYDGIYEKEDNLILIAQWYVEQQGCVLDEIVHIDRYNHTVDMYVLEGGYESTRWEMQIEYDEDENALNIEHWEK